MPLGTLPLNPFAKSNVNAVSFEAKTITTGNRVYTTAEGPYHAGSLKILRLIGTNLVNLVYGTDYEYGHPWADATLKLESKVYASIVIHATVNSSSGAYYFSYNAVGGSDLAGKAFTNLSSRTANQALTESLESVITMATFPTITDVWSNTNLGDISRAKASLAQMGLTMTLRPN